jgi:hypothetical protein
VEYFYADFVLMISAGVFFSSIELSFPSMLAKPSYYFILEYLSYFFFFFFSRLIFPFYWLNADFVETKYTWFDNQFYLFSYYVFFQQHLYLTMYYDQ